MDNNSIVCFFGRLQPMTIAHENIFRNSVKIARKIKGDFLIYLSKSHGDNKNPLDYKDKLNFVKKLTPEYRKYLVSDWKGTTLVDVLKDVSNKGYNEDFYFVAGGDRHLGYTKLFSKYNQVEWYFDTIHVVNAGTREGSISASLIRNAVVTGDQEFFMQNIAGNKSKIKLELWNYLKRKLQ